MKPIGHDIARSQFEKALNCDCLHHAWLVQGPSGIGKRTLVNHFTNLLLGRQDSHIQAQITSGAHKDLYIPKADASAKTPIIKVEAIRELIRFFQRKSALGGWRVGIIDAVDNLNESGMNALLKTLEEPPEKSILFLIWHGRAALLPTIVSRCQTMRLSPLTLHETSQILEELDADTALAQLAKGRPGLALGLKDPDIRAAYDAGIRLAKTDKPTASIKAKTVNLASKHDDSFAGFVHGLQTALADRAETQPRYAKIWLLTARFYADALDDNLDKVQTATRIVELL